jgi:hypothetical protein
MEDLAAVVLAVEAAVGAYGTSVLTRAEDGAAEATVALGRSLIQKILHRAGNPAQVRDAVTDLAAAPDDQDALAALRLQLKKALAADPVLGAEVAGIIRESGMTVENSGSRVNIAETVTGIQSTGENANIAQQTNIALPGGLALGSLGGNVIQHGAMPGQPARPESQRGGDAGAQP